ncbi:MAG: polymer-forming cytoskeletal protein [Clostridiales bacterium]|nr:polymer-forming cytoskeletal protein [Clostridiales bacterium]
MSSFNKKYLHVVHPEKASRLGPTLCFDGEINGKEDIAVEGQVRGKINLSESDLFVVDQGRVEAEICARNVSIQGEVIGNIEARGRVLIERKGRMKGNISASVIAVEEGAQFKGSVKIKEKSQDSL